MCSRARWMLTASPADRVLAMTVASASLPVVGKHLEPFGALAAMTEIAAHPRVRADYTALAEGAAVVGSIQIRNRATLAGNICNASPAADTSPALLVFGAIVSVAGPDGERHLPLDDLFVRSRETTLRRGDRVPG